MCSSDLDLYFKVKLSTGKDIAGHLYYSSPEEYEKHWHTELSLELKQNWLEKYTEELERRTSKKEKSMKDYVLIR